MKLGESRCLKRGLSPADVLCISRTSLEMQNALYSILWVQVGTVLGRLDNRKWIASPDTSARQWSVQPISTWTKARNNKRSRLVTDRSGHLMTMLLQAQYIG